MKRFSFEINERGLCIFADRVPIIECAAMRISVVRLSDVKYIPRELICEGDSVTVRFERAESSVYAESKNARIVFTESSGVLTAHASIPLARYTFSPSGAVKLAFVSKFNIPPGYAAALSLVENFQLRAFFEKALDPDVSS